jgi:multidrug efflux system outer membrane protein
VKTIGSRVFPACALGILLTACTTVGPNYTRPPVEVPAGFRDAGAAAAPATAATSLADAKWWDVFGDQALQSLIRTALERNFDLRIAASRVLQAQAAAGITRADSLPTVGVGVEALDQRTATTTPRRNVAGLGLEGSASWQLDFWGRFRRANEAARAELLASDWGRKAVMTSIVSEVGDAYFGLRMLDLELDISQRTLESRRESLRLTQVREQGGVTTLVDVRQAEQLVYGAAAQITTLERQIEQQENLISILLGDNPGAIARGLAIPDQPLPPDVPAGLPSALLERRPDIQRAEQELVAANAEIGVARSAYFPTVSLTGSGGVQSTALTALLTGGSAVWSAVAGAAQPLFTGGRTRSQVALAEARRDEAVLTYQQTAQQAFREVSDALVGYRRVREFREQQALLFTAAQDARRLADIRYQGGATSYLEVLDADTRRFAAELGLADAQGRELEALVEIYRALGGGWQ